MFAAKIKERNEKVLVHCHIGVNRSPTVVLAYLMKYEGYTLKSAVEHVKARLYLLAYPFPFLNILVVCVVL